MNNIPNKINNAIFIIFLFVISIKKINSFSPRCGAGKFKVKKKPGILNVTTDNSKRNLATEWTKIKIKVDYTSFKKPYNMDQTTFNKITYLIDETTKEFSEFIKIQHINIRLNKYVLLFECEIDSVALNYGNFLFDNDLVIFPSFEKTLDKSTLAAARYCLISSKDKRPCAGNLYINRILSFDKENTDLYIKHILLHEITHILVFEPYLLAQLSILNYDEENDEIYINSPKVIEKARKHFNCNSLERLLLENQGGSGTSGSHWEERYMHGDYMVGSIHTDHVISDITLALFEDSGFYKVDYNAAELFRFGKNKGCDFFNKNCIENGEVLFENEFCMNDGEPKCTQSRISKGECLLYDFSIYNILIPEKYQYFGNSYTGGYPYAEFCPISEMGDDIIIDYYPDNYFPLSCKVGISNLPSEYGEKIGGNSFCFESSLLPSSSNYLLEKKAICYEIKCDYNNKKIIIFLRDSTFSCPENGGIISVNGFKGEINCPKFLDICSFKHNDMCNELFDCIHNRFNNNKGKYIKFNYYINLIFFALYYFLS